jgi:uncharacterized phiE125 gp8 family phage protein
VDTLARNLSTAPTVEPVTVNEARDFLRIDFDDDEVLVGALITAAREYVEGYTERALVNQTWTVKMDDFWGDCVLELPYPPLSSVTSITYVDTDGASQTVATATYTVDTDSEPGRIYLAYGKTWPTARSERNAVTITFVAGYGAAASAVPDRAKTAIKMLVGDMYENRETVLTGTIVAEIPTVKRLLDTLRVPEGS